MSAVIKTNSAQHQGHLEHLKKEQSIAKPEKKPETKVETETKTKKDK